GKTLRQRAEEAFREKAAGMPENVAALSPDEVRQTLHELRVHQIELEMQNDELRRAQGELEASRVRYFDLYDLAPIGYFTLSEAGLILEANLAAATLLGVARGALVKKPISRFILRDDQAIYCQLRKQLFGTNSTSSGQAGEPQACELRMVKMDGTVFWAHLEATAAQDAGGAPVCRVGLSDITAQKQAEAALQQVHDELEHRVTERTTALRRANKERRTDVINRKRVEELLHRTEGNFRRSLDDSPLGVRIVTVEGETIYANRAMLDIYGYDSVEELRTTPIENRYTPQSYAEFKVRREKRKEDDGPSEYEISIVRKNGEIRHLQVFRKDILWDDERQYQVIYRDITERKQAENDLVKTVHQLQETRDMLIQFEKEAAVGRLAVGIAHEILNPAGIISSRLQFLEEETLSEPARENVRISREQLQRIVKISHDLLQSSTKKPTVLVGGDLRRVIEVGLQMTERRIKEDHIQVEYNPPSETIPVKMERDRLVKVMVNLILNACDAMMGNHSKRMIIAVYCPEVSSTRPSVRLIVTDNGHGILAGELDKIFQPFFTRKDPGNDMGGTSFIVKLPLDHP
ncbi:MAG: PAS domain S-box protein, partial [Deltaproteobacteria bacterium]|nr:PAS domain S-box protein [Deltaproteobacteria bacterium]